MHTTNDDRCDECRGQNLSEGILALQARVEADPLSVHVYSHLSSRAKLFELNLTRVSVLPPVRC